HGHWAYCPFDMEHFEAILNATAKGLKDAGVKEDEIKQRVYSKANEFEDIVDNCVLAVEHPDTRKGRSMKYLREAFAKDENKPSLPAGYAVFADVQMRIFNPNADFAKDYCKDYDKKAKPVLEEVLMAFGKELQLGPSAVKGALTEEEITKLANHLKKFENWDKLAYEYAKLTANLEQVTEEPMTPFLSRLQNEPDARAQLIQIALQKGHEPWLYMESFEVFREQFRASGKTIRHDIFAAGDKGPEKPALPYAYLSSRKTSLPLGASFGKTRAKQNGLQFKRKAMPLTLPPKARNSNGSLADILLVCDNSGSMAGSPYETLVSSAYALFEGIKAERKAHLLEYGMIQFSDAACQSWTGWHKGFEEIERAFYETIKSRKFGGTTHFPADLLRMADRNGCAIVGISDGMMDNDSEAIAALLAHIGPLVWFQVGSETEVYTALKNAGKAAYPVNGIDDLPASLLQAMHSMYRRG
ncbi:MAG: vWA domain-containing protein, partial [Nanoarchaeota archaeon]|nr:vWA domain-containing protein [Nanoarchaeota archaeon]